jgi:hypothetical protein
MTQHTNTAGFVVGMESDAAFSVFYEDGEWRLRFVFDVDKNPKKIHLAARPLQGGRLVDAGDDATRARVNLALDRVKTHLEGLGLFVEVD